MPRRADHLAPRLVLTPEGGDAGVPAHHAPRTRLPVWACAPYQGPVRDVITAWKEHGRGDLTNPLVALAGAAATQLVQQAANEVSVSDGATVVVPLPSTSTATRRRGFSPSAELARVVAQAHREVGRDAVVIPALSTAKKSTQKTLDARDRFANLHGAVRLIHRHRDVIAAAQRIILVDDVVTTGATLAHGLSALSPSTGTFVAGFALAITPGAKSRQEHPGNTT